MHRTQKVHFQSFDIIDLGEAIQIPSYVDERLWKCKVEYDTEIRSIQFTPYIPRKIESFKLIYSDNIDYTYKGDRTDLMRLYDQRLGYDDVIIIKDDYVTDSYWSNLIFEKDDQWYTSNTPLLEGVMRAFLLDSKLIKARTIKAEDLSSYNSVMPINALNSFDPSRAIDIQKVIGL